MRKRFVLTPTLHAFAVAIALISTAALTGFAQGGRALNPVGGQPGGPPITPKPGGPLAPDPATYKIDAIEFFLTPDQFVEYKFDLKAGAMMVFTWKATAPVDVDFHTVPEGKPISASETFMRGRPPPDTARTARRTPGCMAGTGRTPARSR